MVDSLSILKIIKEKIKDDKKLNDVEKKIFNISVINNTNFNGIISNIDNKENMYKLEISVFKNNITVPENFNEKIKAGAIITVFILDEGGEL